MMTSSFFEAATILFREGLEAMLVIAALAAYLNRIGASDKLVALYAGAGGAILASIAGAWVFEQFYGGAHNDLLEGAVILLSAALMFYVSGWLFVKQDPRRWQAYLKTHTDRVVAGGTLYAVAMLAFLAVFREGAETVLFLHALAKTSGGWNPTLLAGLGVAGLILIGLYALIGRTTRKLPLRAVFLVTSLFLFLMGLKFIGQGLQEFQEQALVPFDVVPGADALSWLGLNPTWEALGLQLLVVAAAAVGVAYTQLAKVSPEPAKPVAGQ